MPPFGRRAAPLYDAPMSRASSLRTAGRAAARRALLTFGHLAGRATRRYYFEDFVRVYPDAAFGRTGRRRAATDADRRNFRTHARFYEFAAQFVRDRVVADVGCGSGYGCRLLREAGAAAVHGTDLSRHALRYAQAHFGRYAFFTRQSVVDLHLYAESFADVVVSSEVLEHIREYALECRALDELRRITRPGGLVVLGTPNTELLPGHGFSFDELHSLFSERFDDFRIFENALVPYEPDAREAWRRRAAAGRVGVVVDEEIDESEVLLPTSASVDLKRGDPPGDVVIGGRTIDTSLLRNPISWVVVAAKPG